MNETSEIIHRMTAPDFPEVARIIATTGCSLIAGLGTIANGIAFLAIMKNKNLRTIPNILTANMCICDLFTASTILTIMAANYSERRWGMGDMACQLFAFWGYLIGGVSNWALVWVTLNRYFTIVFSKYHQTLISMKKTLIYIGIGWFIQFICLLPILFQVYGHFGWSSDACACTVFISGWYVIVLLVISFGLPIISMICAYTHIYIVVRTSARKMRAHKDKDQGKKENQESKVTRLAVSVFLTFLITLGPYLLLKTFVTNPDQGLYMISVVIAWFSIVINPILYVVQNGQIWKACCQLLGIKGKDNSVSPPSVEQETKASTIQ